MDLCFTEACLAKAHVLDEQWLSVKTNRDAVAQWKSFYEDEKDANGNKKYPFVGVVVEEGEAASPK